MVYVDEIKNKLVEYKYHNVSNYSILAVKSADYDRGEIDVKIETFFSIAIFNSSKELKYLPREERYFDEDMIFPMNDDKQKDVFKLIFSSDMKWVK